MRSMRKQDSCQKSIGTKLVSLFALDNQPNLGEIGRVTAEAPSESGRPEVVELTPRIESILLAQPFNPLRPIILANPLPGAKRAAKPVEPSKPTDKAE